MTSIPSSDRPDSPSAPESRVFREAQADARNASRDALHAFAGTFASIALNSEADPVERFNAGERLRAFTAEISSRDRVERLTEGEPTYFDAQHRAWADLAAIIKERVSVPDILALGGIVVTRTGRSRGRNEFHSACPVCRDGVDRLVCWDGPGGRVWCRQCHWSADVIAVAQSLLPGCDSFWDAVRALAALAGPGHEVAQ